MNVLPESNKENDFLGMICFRTYGKSGEGVYQAVRAQAFDGN
jgi:phage tail protein X